MSAQKPSSSKNSHEELTVQVTLHPLLELWLQQIDILSGVAGVIAVILIHGFRNQDPVMIRILAAANPALRSKLHDFQARQEARVLGESLT